MAGILRVDFINHSKTDDVTIDVVTEDAVFYSELLTTTPANQPGGPTTAAGPGPFKLKVLAGQIFGFFTKAAVQITNPSPQLVSAIYAFDKDPWPQPPPTAPPGLTNLSPGEFLTRYLNFNTVGGKPMSNPTPVLMTLTPVVES